MSSSSSNVTLADSCISIASILRCYTKRDSNLQYFLLIIPVALELIFSTSLIFTNWGSGRRHLLLVAEGWVFFALSLVEVLSHQLAGRDHMSTFRVIDQTIGALSFTQLLFYMLFLYAFVCGEVLSSVPSRIRRISRLYLLIFIPAVIAMNTVASFAGISYVNANNLLHVSFKNDRDHFIWTFFSAVTLALLTVFQASCFLFAFYRLVRAFLTQRKIETAEKDAAVLFRGIGWMNAGIKLGAIETVVGYVYLGIKVAYVRRGLRLFSRALLCIAVAKGTIDATEDFRKIRDEFEYPSRSKIRNLISNPRLSTFRQLSPNATAFHNIPRAPSGSKYSDLGTRATNNGRPHPYASGGMFTARNGYAQSPLNERLGLDSGNQATKSPTGMDEFSRIRAQRMSQQSGQRVTVYYAHGTPKLHLRLSDLDLPSPPMIADSSNSQSVGAQEGWFSTSESNPTPKNRNRSRFSVTTRGSVEGGDEMTAYGQQTLRRYGSNPYGNLSPASSPARSAPAIHRGDGSASTSATHGHNNFFGNGQPVSLEPPSPVYLDTPTRRFSGYSSSGFSAVSAEIVDTPRRKLSFSKQKSALARAVLYPTPSTKVAMTLAEGASASIRSSHHRQSSSNTSLPPPPRIVQHPYLPGAQRPSSPPSQRLPPPPVQVRSRSPPPEQRDSFVRQSVIDDEGNVVTVTAIAPSIDEEYDDLDTPNSSHRKSRDRSTRALSGYSVRSVPETLQAVRELAKQFPGPPVGAVVANIGIRAPNLVTVSEESLSRSATPSGHVSSIGHTAESTDTEEVLRRRIPAEIKMKTKQFSEAPSIPLPPVPRQQQQQKRQQQQQQQQQQRPQQPPRRPAGAQFVNAASIDPFDDDDGTSYRGSQLSPLSMSVKLRHPMSYISSVPPPSTQRHSGMTTTTGVTSPITPFSAYSNNQSQIASISHHGHSDSQSQSREEQVSPGIVDFGMALKEWDSGLGPVGKRVGRPMGDLPSLVMVEGHRRSLSAKTRAEFEKERKQNQGQVQGLPQELDLDELPDQLHQLKQVANEKPAAPGRIKSIGKAPRRVTPIPTRGGHIRGSMHLQPLVIPSHPSTGRDVPMSAVGAGGLSVVSGVNAVGMNVQIVQDDAEFSATTVTEDGRGVLRDSEALSIEDGGYVPIRFQGRSKGSF